MLDALRRGATGWVAKILLLVPLVLAFAVWGIGDMVRRPGAETVARVGKTEIGVEQFQQAYQTELSNLSRQFGRRLTPDQARMFGIESRVLSRLVGTVAIDTKAREMGLTISDQAIAEAIRTEPGLQGVDGKFSRVAFDAFLRNAGLSERGYIAQRRADDVREQLAAGLTAGVTVPQTMVDMLHRFNEETRVLEHVTLDAEKVVQVAEPDETKLKEYFEAEKRRYVVPELKSIAALLLTKAAIAKRIAVGDDDVKTAYEAEKEAFGSPEIRRIQQLAFPDMAAAETAYATLSKAANFVEAAKGLGYKEGDIELGQLARKDMIDAKIADAAFALKKDEVSKPVAGQFSTVILRVAEIVAGKQRTLDEVKGELKARIGGERASREVQTVHDRIEDERSAGKTLKDIAQKFELELKSVPAIDRKGAGADGKPVAELPDAERIAVAVFGVAAGGDADAIELGEGGYAWVDVLATTPEKQKALDDVKAEVRTAWLDAEKLKELGSVTAKLVERVIKGEPFEAIAKEAGGTLTKTTAITRKTSPQGLSQNGVQQAFILAKGGAASTATADGKSRSILRVVDIVAAPAATKEQSEAIRTQLTQQLQTDTLNAFVAGLQARYGVTVNDATVRQVLGQTRDQ